MRPFSLLHPKKPALHANTDSKVQLSSNPIVASHDDPSLVAAAGRVNSLIESINAKFSAADKRLEQFRAQHVREYQDRRNRLERFERTLDELRRVWEPRLDALATKFGRRVDVHPTVKPGRRSADLRIQIEAGEHQFTA